MVKRVTTTVRLSEDARTLLELLSEQFGLSQAGMLELAVRQMAKREKITSEQMLERQLVSVGEGAST